MQRKGIQSSIKVLGLGSNTPRAITIMENQTEKKLAFMWGCTTYLCSARNQRTGKNIETTI